MTESILPPAVQALIDRQEILDCELRYCSGVDRFDREMLLSAYHPGAMDDHGAFVGTAEEFVDWAFAYHSKYQHGHKHYILNHRCEFDGEPRMPRHIGCSPAAMPSHPRCRFTAAAIWTDSKSAAVNGQSLRANA